MKNLKELLNKRITLKTSKPSIWLISFGSVIIGASLNDIGRNGSLIVNGTVFILALIFITIGIKNTEIAGE